MSHVAPCQPSPPVSNRRTLYSDVPVPHVTLGASVGTSVGAGNGIELGGAVGSAVGISVGVADGRAVGAALGIAVGGVVGHRLRNEETRGCLNTPLGNLHSHALNALGNCSTPTDWLWPPAWEHDKDCSLMQYCGYPSNWTTMHNVCKYDQSCAEVGGGSADVRACNGSSSQRFAFIAAH